MPSVVLKFSLRTCSFRDNQFASADVLQPFDTPVETFSSHDDSCDNYALQNNKGLKLLLASKYNPHEDVPSSSHSAQVAQKTMELTRIPHKFYLNSKLQKIGSPNFNQIKKTKNNGVSTKSFIIAIALKKALVKYRKPMVQFRLVTIK